MGMKAGIIGLPNVGKSTLFSTITKQKVLIANYPFATIDSNIGIYKIDDSRLNFLEEYFESQKKISNIFTFVDIAGLVKGASKGEGLGNKFLHHIRNVDLLCHVIRCFEDQKITNTQKRIDPVKDLETINLELIFADLEIVTKRYQKINKEYRSKKTSKLKEEYQILKTLKATLETYQLLKNCNLKNEEKEYANSIGLITLKPIIYIANIDEESLLTKENKFFKKLKTHLSPSDILIKMSIKCEYELSNIEDQKTRLKFLELYQIKESAINYLARKAREYLNLGTFFTASKKEVRAWTFTRNTEAKEVAKKIHSDISKGFIMVEIYNIKDLIEFKNLKTLKNNGKYRFEGKKYLVKDGDVCFFKFNV